MYPLLLLYRMIKGSYGRDVELHLGHEAWPAHRNVIAEGRKLAEVAPMLFEVVHDEGSKGPRWRTEGLYLKAKPGIGETKPSLSNLAGELANDRRLSGPGEVKLSDMELTAAVLAQGMVYGQYGSTYTNFAEDVLHLFVCGIDWTKFVGVTSEIWSEFDGTDCESSESTKLDATLTCRCDREVTHSFGIEPPSLAKLIVTLSAGQLEEIFED